MNPLHGGVGRAYFREVRIERFCGVFGNPRGFRGTSGQNLGVLGIARVRRARQNRTRHRRYGGRAAASASREKNQEKTEYPNAHHFASAVDLKIL